MPEVEVYVVEVERPAIGGELAQVGKVQFVDLARAALAAPHLLIYVLLKESERGHLRLCAPFLAPGAVIHFLFKIIGADRPKIVFAVNGEAHIGQAVKGAPDRGKFRLALLLNRPLLFLVPIVFVDSAAGGVLEAVASIAESEDYQSFLMPFTDVQVIPDLR